MKMELAPAFPPRLSAEIKAPLALSLQIKIPPPVRLYTLVPGSKSVVPPKLPVIKRSLFESRTRENPTLLAALSKLFAHIKLPDGSNLFTYVFKGAPSEVKV